MERLLQYAKELKVCERTIRDVINNVTHKEIIEGIENYEINKSKIRLRRRR
jgi:hypothetical protein